MAAHSLHHHVKHVIDLEHGNSESTAQLRSNEVNMAVLTPVNMQTKHKIINIAVS